MCAILPDTDLQAVGRGTTKRSSPSSPGLGEHRSGQARPRDARIGGGVRQLPEAPPPFRVREAVPFEGLTRLSPRKGGASPLVVANVVGEKSLQVKLIESDDMIK
jgi:hypothetical protein